MADMTGHPTRCPHGEPIPDIHGIIVKPEDVCVMNLAVGTKGEISRVRTHDAERLQYFRSLGLVPGEPFEILGRAPFNGPMRLRIKNEEVVIGAELTKVLWVTTS